MRKYIFIFISFFILSLDINAQGLKLDAKAYSTATEWVAPKDKGFSSANLPSRISYRQYCPTPNQQGDVSTCVGWAAAYGALSTQQNIQMGVTNYMHKWARAFDPHFIYSFIKNDNDHWCNEGSSLGDAMKVLENYGCKPRVWEPWLECNDKKTFNEFTIALSSFYKIEDWYSIPNDGIVENTKMALSYRLPVVIGMYLTESFMKGSSLTYGQYSPRAGEKYIGGHAMCVVGYDDSKFGGSFEVMNSYGKNYGDGGFVWISYRDFAATVGEAYVMKTTQYKQGACSFGDCANSYSRYKFENGDVYEGIISNSLLDDYGSYLYNDGSFYVGGYDKGRKSGYGLMYDIKSQKFYNTNYNNDVLVDYSVKTFGYAQSEAEKKLQLTVSKISSELPSKAISDFDQTQKALERFEAPDNPITISETNAKNDCTYGQCSATAKSTGERCRHCVSNSTDIYCWQHK
jgi:hypothetical protein